jgi:hypothetical protein
MATDLTRSIRDGLAAPRLAYAAAQREAFKQRDRRRFEAAAALTSPYAVPAHAGFLVLPAGSLPGVMPIVAEAHASLAAFDRERPPAGKNKKRFLVNVLYREALTAGTELLRFALRPEVIATVSHYLGLVPILTTVGVYFSDATEDIPTSSQLYHCDADDTTQVKVFVYCTDVTPASGPLTLVDATVTAEVQQRTDYLYGKRLSDDQVRVSGTRVDEHAIIGVAGTVAFVDTSRCFHYGSRVTPGAPSRLAVILQYLTPYSFMLPGPYPQALPFRHLIDPSMSETQRMVLGE